MYYFPLSNPVALFIYKITFWSVNYSACVVYILKQLFSSVAVKVLDIYRAVRGDVNI